MIKRPSNLPVIVVSGASGTIGKHFVHSFCDHFYIYALARRTQREVGVVEHKNINWLRLDIAHEDAVKKTMDIIAARKGADFFLHLAGFYDFGKQENREYERTNVIGTRNLLKHISKLNLKRFIFASSLTVTDFTKNNKVIDENSPADATFPYARSKRFCEEMIRDHSQYYPCTVLRLAAIFSDWCEYGPLFMFLKTWLSNDWNARIIAGNGSSAVPYLHVKNLNSLLHAVMENTSHLPDYHILIASNDGCTTHQQLFDLTWRYTHTEERKAIFIPKYLAWFGVYLRDIVGQIVGNRPFERPWMLKYVNHQLKVDASFTRELLFWKPIARYNIERRLLFLIENMKSNPFLWKHKNYEALFKVTRERPNLRILEAMILLEEEIKDGIIYEMNKEANSNSFIMYKRLPDHKLKERINGIYDILKQSVRSGDRLHSLKYARHLAMLRIAENFEVREVIKAINTVGAFVAQILNQYPALKGLEQRIYDEINLTIQLITDEVADTYERVTGLPAEIPEDSQ